MKVLKPREIPVELLLLRMLHPRMKLPDEQRLLNLEQGFAGERRLDAWLEDGLTSDCLVINDLLLEQNHNIFQIDTLLIFQEKVYILDAKHSYGDFYIEEDTWRTVSGTEIQNPQLQMKRRTTLLRKLLQQHHMYFPIETFLIFTHPEFYLYNAKPQLSAVFPAQIPRFLRKLNNQKSRISPKQKKLAEQLLTLHKHENPHTRFPDYDYDRLKKGVVCSACQSFMRYQRKKWLCPECGSAEDTETAVMRSVVEYRFLFPERKVTTNTIYDWCGIEGGDRKIRRILLKNFNPIGHGKSTYYVE